MEINKDENRFLDLLIRPGFCVEKGRITAVNQAAQCLLLCPGTPVAQLLLTGQEEYATFREGCLYLQVQLASGSCGASVLRVDDTDWFILDQESDSDALTAMALAARVLREPLSGMMICAQQLSETNGENAAYLAGLRRNMHRMLRLLGNMADAGRCADNAPMELRDIPAVFADIFDRAGLYVSQTGRQLQYACEFSSLQGLVNPELLERAVWNILSNAIKFSPTGSLIRAELTRSGRMLTLSIRDSGSGIARNLQQTLFQRYLRQPGIEDGRYGLGLGMLVVRSAAAAHGGAVLVDQPDSTGTRVSMTLALRQDTENALRSPRISVDYSGELDHALVELADCLPTDAYL